MVVKPPIETAKDWLQTAELTLDAKKYEQSLYALEMSVEIAFKAVLLSVRVEAPKAHDIRKIVHTYLVGNKKMPKQFLGDLDDYISTFGTLLRLRPLVGYGFESDVEKGVLEDQAKELWAKCSKIVIACQGAIKNAEK